MRTVREILKESDPQEIADILLRLHLNTLFEQAEPEDTVADIRRLVEFGPCRRRRALPQPAARIY